jgi:hypothetical protein
MLFGRQIYLFSGPKCGQFMIVQLFMVEQKLHSATKMPSCIVSEDPNSRWCSDYSLEREERKMTYSDFASNIIKKKSLKTLSKKLRKLIKMCFLNLRAMTFWMISRVNVKSGV